MPAALAGGATVLAIVATVIVVQSLTRPRTAVVSVSLPVMATSDTPLGAVPVVPPEVSRQETLAQRPIRYTARPIEPSYTVAAGDTLSSIAQRHNTTVAGLRGINNLSDVRLTVGQRLIIP
jgi:LysM repeat protein